MNAFFVRCWLWLVVLILGFSPVLAQSSYGVSRDALETCFQRADRLSDRSLDSLRAGLKPLRPDWGEWIPSPGIGGGTYARWVSLYLAANATNYVQACLNEYHTARADGTSAMVRARAAGAYAQGASFVQRRVCESYPNSYFALVILMEGGHAVVCADLATGLLMHTEDRNGRAVFTRSGMPSFFGDCMNVTYVQPHKGGVVNECVSWQVYESLRMRIGTGEPPFCSGQYTTVWDIRLRSRRTCLF